MIIDHNNAKYMKLWKSIGPDRFNGAYYYSKEIVDNIIPYVETDRNFITVNVKGEGCNHAVVWIHNNVHPENYDWLSEYDDLVLVCGVPSTCDKVKHLGQPIYLPLSIDVNYVKSFMTTKTKDVAFVGRKPKRFGIPLPPGTDILENLPREQLLSEMAKYSRVYAVGRVAIEAKVLGCKVLPYDSRYPNPSIWKVIDNSEVIDILQSALDKIDKRGDLS